MELPIQAVYCGFFKLGELTDEPCSRAEMNEMGGLHDSRGIATKFDIAAGTVDPLTTRWRDREKQGRTDYGVHSHVLSSTAP